MKPSGPPTSEPARICRRPVHGMISSSDARANRHAKARRGRCAACRFFRDVRESDRVRSHSAGTHAGAPPCAAESGGWLRGRGRWPRHALAANSCAWHLIARSKAGLEPHPRRPIQATAPEPVADPVTKRVQRQNHEFSRWVGVPSDRADLDAEGERAPERSRSAWVGFCSEESGCRRLDRFPTMSGGVRKKV